MLKPFKNLFLAGSVLALLCLAWYLMLYRTEVSKLHLLKQETQNVAWKLQSLRVTEEQIASLETQIGSLQSELAKTQRKLLAKNDLPKIIQRIQRRARRYGLRFGQVIPDYEMLIAIPDQENGPSDILQLTVHMKLQGYYKNFGNFVNSLPTLPFYVSVGEVTLLYNETIHPELEIIVDTVLYLRESRTDRAKT